jgi:hypothetical protein
VATIGHALATLDEAPPAVPVPQLEFKDFFKPVGARGLEFTDKVRDLDGKRVRLLGHMVRQDALVPGLFLFTARPCTLHEEEYGFADDLPAATVHVFMPGADAERPAPFTPGPMLLTGTLSLGNRLEADGRISRIRLALEKPAAPGPRPGADAASAAESKPEAPSTSR